MSQAIQISTSCGVIRGKAWGPVDGKPVLALHGWLDNANTFENLAPLLAPTFRLVAVDLPGHGKSHHLAAGYRYHLIDWVCEMGELIDQLSQLGSKKPAIIAHSLGGAVGLFLAALLPERIESVALFDSLGPINTESHDLVEKVRLHLRQQSELSPTPRHFDSLSDAVSSRKKSTLSLTHSSLSDSDAELLVRGSFGETPHGWNATFDPRLKLSTVTPYTLVQILAFLNAVQCPVRLMRASEGIERTEYGWSQRKQAIKIFSETMVPGDHYFHLAHPERIQQDLNAFILHPNLHTHPTTPAAT